MTADRFVRLASRLNRRQALARLAGLGAAVAAPGLLRGPGPSPAPTPAGPPTPAQTPTPGAGDLTDLLRPEIRPRADWGADLPVRGELLAEDDVRFLLVHHTASTNSYGPDQVADQIRGFYQFHTGPEKEWPDVAYNFFVDRFGGIWEGREGSVAGPVRGDATGGSQGFALLCSLIGDFQTEPVTPEQQASLTRLLAWLGARYGVDTTPGAEVTFVSRGSNRWARGTEVTARTIAGHRDMSSTTCPGDAAYRLLEQALPEAVTALRVSLVAAATTTTSTTSTTSTTTAPASTAVATTPTVAGASAPGVGDDRVDGGGEQTAGALASEPAAGAGAGTPVGVVAGAVGVAIAVAVAAYRRIGRLALAAQANEADEADPSSYDADPSPNAAGPSSEESDGRQEGDASTSAPAPRYPPPERPPR